MAVMLAGVTVCVALVLAAARVAADFTPAPASRAAGQPMALPEGVAPPVYAPGPMRFRAGERLLYRASWIGIPAATARIELGPTPGEPLLWTARAWIRSSRVVDVVFRMRDYLKEDFAQSSFSTRDTYIRQAQNRRLYEYRATFNHRSGLVTMVTKHRNRRQVQEFISTNPWGPLSGAVMALSQPLEAGRHYAFDVFAGNNRYVFDFRVVRREKISTSAGTSDAWRIVPSVIYLSDGTLRSKARQMTLWVSADERHLPLRIEAETFVGTVRADLVKVEG